MSMASDSEVGQYTTLVTKGKKAHQGKISKKGRSQSQRTSDFLQYGSGSSQYSENETIVNERGLVKRSPKGDEIMID